MTLDYAALTAEITGKLEDNQNITLATCADGKVTARSMAIVNDGLTIMFQTVGYSEKMRQIKANPNVAFSSGNMQIEAVARVASDPGEITAFVELFKVKFPRYYETYTGLPDETTVICEPIKFKLYKFLDGKPCADVLDIKENMAYREVLIDA